MYKTIALRIVGHDEWIFTLVNTRFYLSAEDSFCEKIKNNTFIFCSIDKNHDFGYGNVNTKFITVYKEIVR